MACGTKSELVGTKLVSTKIGVGYQFDNLPFCLWKLFEDI
jgi:hypothetical protein